MPEEPESILTMIESSYQFYIFVFTTFVACMGVGSWLGQKVWRGLELDRRRRAKLPVATFTLSDGDKSFSQTTLFLGGLVGVLQLGILLLYVVVMMGLNHGLALAEDYARDPSAVLSRVAIFMYYPIIMMAFAIVAGAYLLRRMLSLGFPYAAMAPLAIALAIGCLPFFYFNDARAILAMQALSLAILCFHVSYVYGMTLGIRAANPTTGPRVSVEVVNGNSLADAWLYERTDADYRLVTSDGANHIIPATNVRDIREIEAEAGR